MELPSSIVTLGIIRHDDRGAVRKATVFQQVSDRLGMSGGVDSLYMPKTPYWACGGKHSQ